LSDDYHPVLAPRIAVNDDAAILVEWLKSDGSRVEQDEIVCRLEYSKAIVDVPAPRAGWLFHVRRAGEEIVVGSLVASVAASEERPAMTVESRVAELGIKITTKAMALMQVHGIDPTVFKGAEFVKEAQVRAHLDSIGTGGSDQMSVGGTLTPLSVNRRRTAKILVQSSQTVPHSYLSRWIRAERVENRVEKLASQEEMALSVSDLLVKSVAEQAKRHPLANAVWRDDGIFAYDRVNVGFALNQSNGGLFVPVVLNADRMTLLEIVGRVRRLQIQAVRQKFSPADLAGGTVTVTSLTGAGVHNVLPILVPGQSAIVAIGDRWDGFGAPAYCLTVAFDHRVMNGVEAAAFLSAIAQSMEDGDDN